MVRATRREQVRGFTLVEMVLTILILGIMGAVGSSIFTDVMRTTVMVNSAQTGDDQARYALERLAREVREVKWDTSAYLIGTMTASTMAFTRTISATDTAVTVTSAGGNVTLRYAPATAQVLVAGVNSLTLQYRQVDGTAATSAANVRYVVITLNTTDPTSGQGVTQQTRVVLRNS